MNSKTIREINRFIKTFRLREGDMSLARLQTLLEVALQEEIEQLTLIRTGKFNRSAASKNIASWTKLTALKKKGPGYIESMMDPMNMKTRTLKITESGRLAIDSALDAAGLNKGD